MNLQENISRIKEVMGLLTETRKGIFNWLKNYLPNTPEYVIRDLIYRNAKEFNDERSIEEIKNWLDEYFVDLKWKHERNFFMSLDIFDDETRKALEEKIEGFMFPGQDTERHQKQSELLKNRGISEEPIILYLNKDGKYTLGEGWHRTTQAFKMYPDGFVQPNVLICLNANLGK